MQHKNFKNIDEENLIIQKISDIDTNYKNYEKELYNLNKNLEKIKTLELSTAFEKVLKKKNWKI